MSRTSPQPNAEMAETKELIRLFQAVIDNLEKRKETVARARRERDALDRVQGLEAVLKKLNAEFKRRLKAVLGRRDSKRLHANAGRVHKALGRMESQLERARGKKRALESRLRKLEAAYDQAGRYFQEQQGALR